MADEPIRGPYADWRGPYETMSDAEATKTAKAAERAEAKAKVKPEPEPEPEPDRKPKFFKG